MTVMYHGTRAPLQPGEAITPGRRANWDISSPGHVYMTSRLEDAAYYAEQARGRRPTHVYQVSPTGAYESDAGRNPSDYKTAAPLQVIREIDPWDVWA